MSFLHTTELKLRKEEAEFVTVMEYLTDDLQYSSMLGKDIDKFNKQIEELEADQDEDNLHKSILNSTLRELNINEELILHTGERINLYDLMRLVFLINTCIKDM